MMCRETIFTIRLLFVLTRYSFALVMGINGRRLNMIEMLSETVISFQRGKFVEKINASCANPNCNHHELKRIPAFTIESQIVFTSKRIFSCDSLILAYLTALFRR